MSADSTAFRPSLTSHFLNFSELQTRLPPQGVSANRAAALTQCKSGKSSNAESCAVPSGGNLIVLAKPDCPLCKMGMRPVQAMPVLFSHDLDEVVYVCDECGQRTKRTLKRL